MRIFRVKITHIFSDTVKYKEFTEEQFDEWRDTVNEQQLPFEWEVVKEREL